MGSSHTKAFLLLQAHFEGAPLPITDYINDTKSVLDQAARILNAMVDIAADEGMLTAALATMGLSQVRDLIASSKLACAIAHNLYGSVLTIGTAQVPGYHALAFPSADSPLPLPLLSAPDGDAGLHGAHVSLAPAVLRGGRVTGPCLRPMGRQDPPEPRRVGPSTPAQGVRGRGRASDPAE